LGKTAALVVRTSDRLRPPAHGDLLEKITPRYRAVVVPRHGVVCGAGGLRHLGSRHRSRRRIGAGSEELGPTLGAGWEVRKGPEVLWSKARMRRSGDRGGKRLSNNRSPSHDRPGSGHAAAKIRPGRPPGRIHDLPRPGPGCQRRAPRGLVPWPASACEQKPLVNALTGAW
jgi:hypothetical protein